MTRDIINSIWAAIKVPSRVEQIRTESQVTVCKLNYRTHDIL